MMLACEAKELPTINNISTKQIDLKCSHQTTRSEIEDAQEKIKSMHDMDLSYEGSQFDDNGKVAFIKMSLSYDGEKVASFSADRMTLQYKYYGIVLERKGEVVTYIKAGVFE